MYGKVCVIEECEEYTAFPPLHGVDMGMLLLSLLYHFLLLAFTEHLSFLAGLVMFVGGTFAVIVPTPNGAGTVAFRCHYNDDAIRCQCY